MPEPLPKGRDLYTINPLSPPLHTEKPAPSKRQRISKLVSYDESLLESPTNHVRINLPIPRYPL